MDTLKPIHPPGGIRQGGGDSIGPETSTNVQYFKLRMGTDLIPIKFDAVEWTFLLYFPGGGNVVVVVGGRGEFVGR